MQANRCIHLVPLVAYVIVSLQQCDNKTMHLRFTFVTLILLKTCTSVLSLK